MTEDSRVVERRESFRPWAILALVCGISTLLLVVLGTRLTFFNDDWSFLLQRPGLEGGSVWSPHNGQLVVGVDLTFKALVAAFGYAQLPFRLTLGLSVAAVGVAVYLLVAERVGSLLGVAGATVVIFLGPAWEDLLFFASIGPIVALASGLAALYAMEREGRGRDLAACALLIVSVCFSGVGLAFVTASAVAVLVVRAKPLLLWIPGVPTVLYGIWTWVWGDPTSDLSVTNLEHLPRYLFESASIGLASLTGLNHGPHRLLQGELLLAIALVAVIVWVARGGRPSRWVAVPVTAAVAFWVLTGLSFVPGREAIASRYQLIDAALLIVIGAELLRPFRPQAWQRAAVIGVTLLIVLSNVESLRAGFDFLDDESTFAKAETGALEIARGHTSRDLEPTDLLTLRPNLLAITAGRYYDETIRHGDFAHLSPADIEAAPGDVREHADSVLVAAYGIRPVPVPRSAGAKDCRGLAAGEKPAEIELRTGSTMVSNLGTAAVALSVGRFSPPDMPIGIGFLPAGETVAMTVPSDSVPRPWRLTVTGPSDVVICPSAG